MPCAAAEWKLVVQTISSLWSKFLDSFLGVLSNAKPTDALDVFVVAVLLYYLIRLVRETRAMQLVKGIAFILLAYVIASWWRLNALLFIIENVIGSGVLLLAVLFQPELRRALEQLGRSKITGIGHFGVDSAELHRERMTQLIKIICDSCTELSGHKTGALITIERETMLGEIIKTGTVIDAESSAELIGNIFFPKSPLHDGSMIIRGNRVYAAGCYLPLSQNMEIARELGTRHRAALGMSEVSDAVIVVVSEETGAISVAVDSRLQRKLSVQNLQMLLSAKLIGKTAEDGETQRKLPIFRRAKK